MKTSNYRSTALVIILALCGICVTSSNAKQQPPQCIISQSLKREGSLVQYTVSITENTTGLIPSNWAFDVTSDETRLEYIGYCAGYEGTVYGTAPGRDLDKSPVAARHRFTNSINRTGLMEYSLFTLTFRIKENAPAGYAEITLKPSTNSRLTLHQRTYSLNSAGRPFVKQTPVPFAVKLLETPLKTP